MLAKHVRAFSMLGFSLALTGCIHYEHQSAEGKPADQVAVIQQFDKHLTITRIDNNGTLFWLGRQNEYRLGAGTHTLQATWSIGDGRTAPLATTVSLVGGRTYGLYGEASKGRWSYDIRDVETGQSATVKAPSN
ncbi:hypothetical protein [Pseudomonas sp. PS01298]|uniref:hypothetical protein n=1 Tax=Pseudomonas sp. PS01298 TaxID=2991434 RepID=UPI00249B0EB4|nr:hypothetical protein [Pseudomonas sp. PS01298]